MDEEISIIDTNTRNEKVKNFFLKNKKKLIIVISLTILIILSYFIAEELKSKNRIKLANQFNSIIIDFETSQDIEVAAKLIDIVKKQDATYSPLALYFIIDNDLLQDKEKINLLLDILINKTDLKKEIKNLVIYKKALYNSDHLNENELMMILSPIINSESIWKSHSLYLIAEYFYSKNEKQKAKEFFLTILKLENANKEINSKVQKRLNRDLSE